MTTQSATRSSRSCRDALIVLGLGVAMVSAILLGYGVIHLTTAVLSVVAEPVLWIHNGILTFWSAVLLGASGSYGPGTAKFVEFLSAVSTMMLLVCGSAATALLLRCGLENWVHHHNNRRGPHKISP